MNLKNFIIVILVFLNTPFVNLGTWGSLLVYLLLSILIPAKRNGRLLNNQFGKSEFKLFILIFIISAFQSIFYYIFLGLEFKYLSRGISTSLQLIVLIYFSYKLVRFGGRDALNIFFDGLFLSYSISVIYALVIFGFTPVINACFSIFIGGLESAGSETDAILEQSHAILLIMPLISVFYLKDYLSQKDKQNIWRMAIAIIVSLMAYKRIAIGAAFVVFFLSLFKKFYSKKVILLAGSLGIVILMLYVYVIKQGYVYLFTEAHDIDLAYRDVIWTRIDNLYSFDIGFIGHGWDFITKYLQEVNMVLFGNNLGGIHNDILKVYIDFGFIGSIFYFAYFLIIIPLRLKNRNISFLFWLSQIYLFIIYLTDNAMIYSACQISAYLIPFSIVAFKNKLKHG